MINPSKQKNLWNLFEKCSGYLLLSLVFLLLVSFLIREIAGFDVWFHLKAGQWILENLKVPEYDMFSYTVPDHLWLDSHWLFQVVLYTVYSLGKVTGIQFLKIVVFIAAFMCLFKVMDKRNYIISAVFLFIAVILTQERFFARPEMATILFMGLYFVILHNYKYRKTKFIWLLPFFQLVWANMHGLFIIGLVMVFAFLAGELISSGLALKLKWYKDTPIKGSKYNKLLIIFFIMITVCFINPYGMKGVSYPFLLFTEIGEEANIWMKTVGELQPSLLIPTDSPIILFYKLLIIFTALTFILNPGKINAAYLIIYGSFLFISLKARRNISLFAFVAAPIAISNINNTSDKIIEYINEKKFINVITKTVIAVLVIVLSVTWIVNVTGSKYYVKKNDVKRFGLGVSRFLYPEKAVDFIEKNNIRGNILNANSIGGYLIWRCTPDRKVFVDGRWEVYGSEFMDSYKAALTALSSFSKLTDKFNINYILLNHISMESRRLLVDLYRSSKWELIYFDDIASIFIRNTNENRKIIKSNPVDFSSLIKEYKTGTVGFQYNNFVKGSFFYSIGLYKNAEYEFKQSVLINPEYCESYNNLGNVYQKMEEHEKAVEAYKKALRLKPDYVTTHINLANLYSKIRKYAQAAGSYRKAIELQPGNADNHYSLAAAYEELGDKTTFLKELEETVRINPDHFSAHYKLAIAYTNTDIGRTLRELEETIRIKPDFAMGYYNLGIAYLKRSQEEKTAYYWKKYLALNPSGSNAAAVSNWLKARNPRYN